MSKRLIASFTLAAFAGTVLPVSALSESSAKMSRVEGSGKVLVQRDGSWQPVGADTLNGVSQVRTGKDGVAVVYLEDGSVVRLASNTQVSLNSEDSTLKLERGRLLGKASDAFSVSTDRTVTKASKGEFVVFTSESGTKLEVLSGNASMVAQEGVVRSADSDVAPEVFQGDNLGRSQYNGDVSMLDDQWKGNWKGKGTGARSDDSDEAAGGKQTTSPDTSVKRPIQKPEPPVETPVDPPVDPPVSNTPPVETTPPVSNTPPPQVPSGSGFPVIGAVLGALGVGGLILLLSNDDDDDPVPFVPSPSVPSPSLP